MHCKIRLAAGLALAVGLLVSQAALGAGAGSFGPTGSMGTARYAAATVVRNVAGQGAIKKCKKKKHEHSAESAKKKKCKKKKCKKKKCKKKIPATGTGPCGTVGSTSYHHVIWIVMENKSYGSVIGSGSAPYETALARRCATAAHWNDAGGQYNSLPNYIALTTGIPTGDSRLDPFRCDCAPSSSVNVTVDNLFRQVRTAGLTEKSYAEGMSGDCGNSGTTYAPKHNPALYMWGGSDRQACSADDVPMGSNSSGAFIDDLRARRLPNFSFIAPDLCNDTHDCGVATGDVYLQTLMGNILASSLYRHGHTAVVVVWDEDTPVPNIVVSPSVHPGTVVESTVSHYSLLRATEDIFGLPRLLSAADAPDLRAPTGL